jgi:hypothetical protein
MSVKDDLDEIEMELKGAEMAERYLSDPELRAEIAKFHNVPNWGWETDEQRAIATAASDAAYAAGREELARDIWEWWSAEGDCFNDEIVAHFEEWLREKGVM